MICALLRRQTCKRARIFRLSGQFSDFVFAIDQRNVNELC